MRRQARQAKFDKLKRATEAANRVREQEEDELTRKASVKGGNSRLCRRELAIALRMTGKHKDQRQR